MAGNHRCPHCRQPVTRTIDNDTAGIPITLHPTPVPRQYALLHIANGGRAVIAESDRTWNQRGTRYYHLSSWRISNQQLAHYPHYVTHECGVTPPTIPDPLSPQPEGDTPPW